ncbi:uncharacterized protein LOC143224751 isoform X3 [Tachypleus tridentatus]|uniref:uncharacterized protein LOC143224751 isoform X3 n=1 Tax=Tachypleus tridentatus TaxID=6853 RepID=UPI003FD3B201
MKERLPNYFPLLEETGEGDDDVLFSSPDNQKCSKKSLQSEIPKCGERTMEASIGLVPSVQTETEVPLGPMSPVQKLLFLLSLFLCLLFFVTFAWLLPCNLPEFRKQEKQDKVSWLTHLNNTEITTNLEAVTLISGSPPFLVVFGMRSKTNNSSTAGLMALSQSGGKIVWYVPLHSVPTSLKCNILDVNKDGIMDCIIRGENGLFVAINSVNGHTFWYLHNHNGQPPPVGLSAPVIIPDCDGDLVPEVVVAYCIQKFDSDNNASSLIYMAVVSGSSGQLLGLLHHLEVCNEIPAVVTRQTGDIDNVDVVFFCSNGSNNGHVWILPSSSLCQSETISSDTLSNLRTVYRENFSGKELDLFVVRDIPGAEDSLIVARKGALTYLRGDGYSEQWNVNFTDNFLIRSMVIGHFHDANNLQVAIVVTDDVTSKTNVYFNKKTSVRDGRGNRHLKQFSEKLVLVDPAELEISIKIEELNSGLHCGQNTRSSSIAVELLKDKSTHLIVISAFHSTSRETDAVVKLTKWTSSSSCAPSKICME